MYKILCWTCYYLGDFVSKILALFDNIIWADIWYPMYNRLMLWSSYLQDEAGFDPYKTEDTTGWPWRKGTEHDSQA